MRKHGESKTTRIMMATVPHVTSGSGLGKFQVDGFLLDRVYNAINKVAADLCVDRTERSEEVCKNLEVITVNVVAVLRLFAAMDTRGNKVCSGTFILKFCSLAGTSEHINRTGNVRINVILMRVRQPIVAVYNQ